MTDEGDQTTDPEELVRMLELHGYDPRDLGHVAALARLAGHAEQGVRETRRKQYFGWCSCGWESSSTVDARQATGATVHHLRTAADDVARRARQTGTTLRAAAAFARANPETHREFTHRRATRSA